MCDGSPRLISLALLGFVIFAVSPESMADGTSAQDVPKAYSSPAEAFDAYRDAYDRQDWRTFFYCHTPKARDHLVFEAFFGCNMRTHNPKVLALLKKHSAQSSVIQAEYCKRYQKKHGVDLAKLIAEHQKKIVKAAAEYFRKKGIVEPREGEARTLVPIPNLDAKLGPPIPARDEKLYREAVSTVIIDKAGFCVAANKFIVGGDLLPRIGKLFRLNVQGDTATARARMTVYHLSFAPGQALKKVSTTLIQMFQFRKIKGSWFIQNSAVK